MRGAFEGVVLVGFFGVPPGNPGGVFFAAEVGVFAFAVFLGALRMVRYFLSKVTVPR